MARPKSVTVTVLLTALVAVGPISTDLYLPSLPAIADHFDSDPLGVQLTLSLFLVGFAVSQLVYGPLSDRFGRRPVLAWGMTLYVAATAGCALAGNIEVLIVARFLQAVGGCAGPVLARAVVRDIHGREGAARVLSYLGLAMALAPALGPILGGYLEVWFGWRANFLALLAYGGAALVGLLVILPETNAWRDPEATRVMRIAANYRALAGDRAYLGYLAVVACAYSGIFAFISGSSFVLIETLGLTPDRYGLCFAIFVAGYMLGSLLSGRLTLKHGLERLILLGAVLGCLGSGVGLLLSLAGHLSVAAILAPVFFFMIGAGLMLPNALAGAIGPYPRMAGAASALVGFAQMGLAAGVGIAVGHLADGTGRSMAGAIAAVSVGALLARLILVRRGARLSACPRGD